MLARRTFLQAGAVAAAAAVAPFCAAAQTLGSAPAAGLVLVDGALADSVSFASAWQGSAHIDRATLLTQWPQLQAALGASGVISGLGRASDLPLVMQLVATQGARLVHHSAHAPQGATAAQATWSADLGQQLAAASRVHVCSALNAALPCARTALDATAPAPGLVAWSVAYG
jgi:hypothetical protein